MGGGNGQKAKMAREKNMEKQKAAKGGRNAHRSLAAFLDFCFIYLCFFFFPSLDRYWPDRGFELGGDLKIRLCWCDRAGSQLETNKKAMTIQV